MFTLSKLEVVSVDQVKELKEIIDGESCSLFLFEKEKRELISLLCFDADSHLPEAEENPSSLTEYLPPLDKSISTTALLDRIVTEFKEA